MNAFWSWEAEILREVKLTTKILQEKVKSMAKIPGSNLDTGKGGRQAGR